MKKTLITLMSVSCIFTSGIYAQEPPNLSFAKQAIIRYHDSGEYFKDISAKIAEAKDYLQKRLPELSPTDKPAIVLDIDETSLSNYPNMKLEDFGGRYEEIHMYEEKANDPAIGPTLELYRFAKANHIAVIFLTGREENVRVATIQNLKSVGYSNWDELILRRSRDQNKTALEYKTAIRKHLTEQGYKIILNIGDQQSDLDGGYAEKTIKLPGPFYFLK